MRGFWVVVTVTATKGSARWSCSTHLDHLLTSSQATRKIPRPYSAGGLLRVLIIGQGRGTGQ